MEIKTFEARYELVEFCHYINANHINVLELSVNSYDLDHLFDGYNIKINSYIIDDKKYYVKDIISLIDKYTKDMSLEDKIYFKINGIIIDGLNVTCENDEIMKLSNIEKIY